jgi:hypothetical protein
VPLPPKFKCIRKFLEVLDMYGKILGAAHLGLGPQEMGPIRCRMPNHLFERKCPGSTMSGTANTSAKTTSVENHF